MGKRNAPDSLEHTSAVAMPGTPATPPKRQKLDALVDVKPSITETPPQTYTLTKELVEDTVLLDLNLQKWRVGQPVGKLLQFFCTARLCHVITPIPCCASIPPSHGGQPSMVVVLSYVYIFAELRWNCGWGFNNNNIIIIAIAYIQEHLLYSLRVLLYPL